MRKQRKDNQDYFKEDIVVNNFDDYQKGLIPGYDLIFQAMEDVVTIHFEKEKDAVDGIILDIGAGTGNESRVILKLDKFKDMKILAIDYSDKMERKFKEKIDQHNIEDYIIKDIMSLSKDSIQKYTNKCRIALSGYTIHHFHTDEKREIYEKMFDLLAPGGLLLNIDLFTYESECIRQSAHDFEIKFINTNIKNECVKQEWLNHYNNTNNNDSHNALDPVEVQIDMLKEIGFVDVECVFRYWQQGIIRATKPSGDETAKKHSLFYLEKSIKIKNEILGSNNNNNKILEETNELNEAFKLELKNELGVVAVGISILSKADEDIRFLIASKVPDIDILGAKTDNKHNFSISHEGFGEYDNFINFLYYIGRGNSIKYPEYLNRIKEKKQNPFENIIQQNARQKYETLHISAGEIILFTILWRYLIGEILKPTIDVFINFFTPNSTEELENPFEKDANEYHLIEKLKDIKNQVSKNQVEQNILHAWSAFLKRLKENSSIADEFGLNNNNNNNKERNKEALEEYVNFLFKDDKININNCQDNQFIKDVLILFVNKFRGAITAHSETLKILHEKARVPIMPFYFLMLGDKEKNLKEQYVFPLLHTFSKENTMYPYTNDQGNKDYEPAVIHAMWVVKPIKDINNTSKQPWYSGKYSFTSYIERLHLISQSVCKPIIDEYFEKEHKKNISSINYQATRAAISQVMARNMSHNIGSHVLSKMVDVKDIKNDSTTQYKSSFENHSTKSNNSGDNEAILNANFNAYLRTRMDFLADIATSEPSMETTCMLVNDVIRELDKNRILLNKISGVENFSYTIKIKDCRNCNEAAEFGCYCTNENNKDIPVSIPNGIMGYHALYIIIENIIRNTAKHQSNINSNGEINDREFILEIRNSKYDNTLYEVLVYENTVIDENKILNEEVNFYKENTGKGQYHNSITNKLDGLVFVLNARINQSALNEKTNRLREGALGLIEMEASAAYLRKLAAEKIDEEIYNLDLTDPESRQNPEKSQLNIIKAVNKNGCLGYRFHLLKPKELLVVDETGEIYEDLKRQDASKSKWNILRENGIWVLQTQNKTQNDYFDIEKVYAFPFMLVIAGNDFNVNKYLYAGGDEQGVLRGNLPFRIIVCKKKLDGNEVSSPWVAYIDEAHGLINYLRKAEELRREPINMKADLAKSTLMDLVWQVWLMNKMEFHKVKIEKEYVKQLIPSYSANDKTEVKIHFAHHGTIDEYNEFNGRCDYLLFYPSSVKSFVTNATQVMSQGKVNQNFDKYHSAKLTESIFNKILIIDERVQASWEAQYSSLPVSKREIFSHCDLYSPIMKNNENEEINLNLQSFGTDYGTRINELIDKVSKCGNTKKLDFIVIHLGIIEKILTVQNKKKEEEDVKGFILTLQNRLDSKIRIIITSGRGKPDNLPKDVPFISFSALSQYTIETPFKPFLNEIIQNTRTFKKS